MRFGNDNIMWFIIEISRPYYTAGKTMLLKTRIRVQYFMYVLHFSLVIDTYIVYLMEQIIHHTI